MRLCLSAALLCCAACGTPTIQTSAALAVVNLSPTDGAVDVPPAAVQSICFSAAIDPGDADPTHFWVADDSGAKADGLEVALADDPLCVKVGHRPLAGQAVHVLHVEAGVRAADGSGTLPVAVEGRFTTAASP